MSAFSYPYPTSRYYSEEPEDSPEYLEAVARSYEERAARARQEARRSHYPPPPRASRHFVGDEYLQRAPVYDDYEDYYRRPRAPPARYEPIERRPIYERAPVHQLQRPVQSRDLEAEFRRDIAIEEYDAEFEQWKASRRQARRVPQQQSQPRRLQPALTPATQTVVTFAPSVVPQPTRQRTQSTPRRVQEHAIQEDVSSLLSLLGLETVQPQPRPPAPAHAQPDVQELLSLLGLAPPTPSRPTRAAPRPQAQAQPRPRAPAPPATALQQHPEIGDILSLFGLDPSTLGQAAQRTAPTAPAPARPSAQQVPAELKEILSLFGLSAGEEAAPRPLPRAPTAAAPQAKSSAPAGLEEQQAFEFFQSLQAAFAEQFGGEQTSSLYPHSATSGPAAAGPSGTSSSSTTPSAHAKNTTVTPTSAEALKAREAAHYEDELLKQAIALSLDPTNNVSAPVRSSSPTPSSTGSDKGKNKAPVVTPTALETLQTLDRTFSDLTRIGEFEFPATVDFLSPPASPRSPSPVNGPELAHTPVNATLRRYIGELNSVLAQVDAVEGGEPEVRALRKELAKKVEAALEEVDVLLWSKWRGVRGREEDEVKEEVKGYDVETKPDDSEVTPIVESDEESFHVVTVEAKPDSEHDYKHEVEVETPTKDEVDEKKAE